VSARSGRYVAAGRGLMSFGPDVADLYERAAIHVAKTLRGANAGDLPVEQPSEFELAINLKTAKALGLTVSRSLGRTAIAAADSPSAPLRRATAGTRRGARDR